MKTLAYNPLEPMAVGRPVHRGRFITERYQGRVVLDLGCRDETALAKVDTSAPCPRMPDLDTAPNARFHGRNLLKSWS
jgi:hypothetical protein